MPLTTVDKARVKQAGHTIVAFGPKITDLTDRSTAFLFADGAGAAVVGPSDTNGFGPVVWGSDGDQADVIYMTQTLQEVAESGTPSWLHMKGQPVFRWATGFIADAAKRCLSAAGLTPDQLDVFAPHQANNRITDSMLRHLKLPDTVKVARTVKHYGNNSAASIPMKPAPSTTARFAPASTVSRREIASPTVRSVLTRGESRPGIGGRVANAPGARISVS